jgi:hypothetical protein
MRALLAIFVTLTIVFDAAANVVDPAPNFAFRNATGKAASLRSLRGQPVVLLIAPSAASSRFRRQVKQINRGYRFFASRKTVLVAAFTGEEGTVESNAPFVVLSGATDVAAGYGLPPGSYGLFVIGTDGNIDVRTSRVLSAQKIIDAIDNAYPIQAAQRQS